MRARLIVVVPIFMDWSFIKAVWNSWQFARGAIMIVVLTHYVDLLTGFSRLEFLSALHALLLSWFQIAKFIGNWLPVYLPANETSALTFVSVSVLPAGVSSIYRRLREKQSLEKTFAVAIGFVVLAIALFFTLSNMGYFFLDHEGRPLEKKWEYFPLLPAAVMTSIIVVSSYFVVVLARASISYRIGLCFVLSVVLAIEVLYWSNNPDIVAWVNEVIESRL